MIVSPQRSLYSIALVFLVFSFGCHSLPPYEPLSQGKDFNPGLRYWEEVSLPADLLGDWYDENDNNVSDLIERYEVMTGVDLIEEAYQEFKQLN